MRDLFDIIQESLNLQEALKINKDTKISKTDDAINAMPEILAYKNSDDLNKKDLDKNFRQLHYYLKKFFNDYKYKDVDDIKDIEDIHIYVFNTVLPDDCEDGPILANILKKETDFDNITIVDYPRDFTKLSMKCGFNAGYPDKRYREDDFYNTNLVVFKSTGGVSIWLKNRGVLITPKNLDEFIQESLKIGKSAKLDKQDQYIDDILMVLYQIDMHEIRLDLDDNTAFKNEIHYLRNKISQWYELSELNQDFGQTIIINDTYLDDVTFIFNYQKKIKDFVKLSELDFEDGEEYEKIRNALDKYAGMQHEVIYEDSYKKGVNPIRCTMRKSYLNINVSDKCRIIVCTNKKAAEIK